MCIPDCAHITFGNTFVYPKETARPLCDISARKLSFAVCCTPCVLNICLWQKLLWVYYSIVYLFLCFPLTPPKEQTQPA